MLCHPCSSGCAPVPDPFPTVLNHVLKINIYSIKSRPPPLSHPNSNVPILSHAIMDITDHELNAILTQICHAKGRKITVILDCCYSSGLTRRPSTTGVRSVPELERGALDDALRIANNSMCGLPGYRCVLDTHGTQIWILT
ncbi:hypothetical protein ARMGADRAFT_1093588 [Armillaria gallica]|uniref:Uncharacterized protein n=1 Tax=Armillaria gallica TaxID=47427 RepID=A0A2H3CAR1_ARMGA|nr:hypothetical protein ARMGADRAFT_1093588 [Armillaria gallica]